MVKVSVIIPAFNSAKYLKRAVDSVLDQSFHDFDLIIINDGSTDNTEDVVKTYLKSYPGKIAYFSQSNKGPAAARNLGISESTGEYIAFLDSDDEWSPTKLSEQVKLFDADSALCLNFTDVQQQKEDEIIVSSLFSKESYAKQIYNSKGLYSGLLSLNFIFTPSVMLRRSALSRFGVFNEKYSIGEDYDLWLRIARSAKISFIKEQLVTRYIHSQSAMSNEQVYLSGMITLLSDFYASENFSPQEKAILKKRLLGYYGDLSYLYFSNQRARDCRVNLSAASQYGFTVRLGFYAFISILPARVIRFLRKLKKTRLF